ncbi:unnamed protein product, partial [Sphacelaria rigidula]
MSQVQKKIYIVQYHTTDGHRFTTSAERFCGTMPADGFGKTEAGVCEGERDMEAGHSLCLDAFTVALFEAGTEKGSYLPTKNLQLTSIQLCQVCRSVSTLQVRVGRDTPPRLWTTCAEQPSTRMNGADKEYGTAVSRIPLLRPRSVTWMACADAEFMSHEVNFLANVKDIKFEHKFKRGLENVVWPAGVRRIKFDGGKSNMSKFNK